MDTDVDTVSLTFAVAVLEPLPVCILGVATSKDPPVEFRVGLFAAADVMLTWTATGGTRRRLRP